MDEARRAALMAEHKDATRERDQLNIYIETLAIRLGIQDDASPDAADDDDSTASLNGSGPLTDDVAKIVYANEFHGMSIPAAAETVLRRWSPPPIKRPIKTTDLLTGLRKGGQTIPESRVVYRSLYSTPRFYKLKGGLWGLAEWYPAVPRSKSGKISSQVAPDSQALLDADVANSDPGAGAAPAADLPFIPQEGAAQPEEVVS